MENRPMPSLNTMMIRAGSLETSFSEATAIEVRLVALSLRFPISYFVVYRRRRIQFTVRLTSIRTSSPLYPRQTNSRNWLLDLFGTGDVLVKMKPIIVIDVLDEWDDRGSMTKFIEAIIGAFQGDHQLPLRVLITSRVEKHI